MTIEDLGSIGELVAAVGVIISLIYVGIQLRGNTMAMRAESRDRNFGNFIATGHPALVDKELMSVWLTGLEQPEELDREDAERFERMLVERFLYVQLVFARGLEVSDPHTPVVVRALLAPILESTAALERWRRFSPRPDFGTFVESLIREDAA